MKKRLLDDTERAWAKRFIPGWTVMDSETRNGFIASPTQNVIEHWDFNHLLWGKVEVKGQKAENRGEERDSDYKNWVELANVRGDPGWVHGLSNWIFFETNDYWIQVSTNRLKEFTLEIIKEPETVFHHKKGLYYKYQRYRQLDVIVQVKTIDLAYLSEQIFKK